MTETTNKGDVRTIFEELYKRKINCGLCIYYGSFKAYIYYPPFRVVDTRIWTDKYGSLDECMEWLLDMANEYYPKKEE